VHRQDGAADLTLRIEAVLLLLLLLLLDLQVRESANCLLHVAKQMGCATFLVRTAADLSKGLQLHWLCCIMYEQVCMHAFFE
jgi:hypothetical protein